MSVTDNYNWESDSVGVESRLQSSRFHQVTGNQARVE